MNANRFRAQGRIPACPHGIPKWREQKSPQQQNARDGEGECQEIKAGTAVKRRLRPDAANAVGTAGHAFPLKDHRPDDLREGERQHGEIYAGEPNREPAEQQCACERRDEGCAKREQHGCGEEFHHQPGPVGAEPEIGRMAE